MKNFTLSSLTIAIVVVAGAVVATRGSSRAGAACDNSYARFEWLQGTWEGSWTNLDFLNTGDVSMEIVAAPDCTGQAIIDGVLDQPDNYVIDFEYHDENGGTILEIVNDPALGTTTITVSADGDVTADGTGLAPGQMGPETVEGTGTITRDHIHLDYTIGLFGGGEADEEIDFSHETVLYHGDLNCDGFADEHDALSLLLVNAQLGYSQPFGCPDAGEDLPPVWGDVNCDGVVDLADAVLTLEQLGGWR